MKHRFALILIVTILCTSLQFAYAKDISDIIKLEGEPVRYLVEYSDESDDPWSWDIDSYWNLVDADGNLLEENFAEGIYKRDGWYKVEAHGLYGIMDLAGSFPVEPRFDYIYDFSEGLARIKENGLYGYMNREFEVVIEPKFEQAENFSGGLAKVEADGLYGFIGVDGSYAINPVFEEVYGFYNDVALVTINGKEGLIDKSGAYIAEPVYNVGMWSEDTDGNFGAEIYDFAQNGERLYGYLFRDGSVIEPRFQQIRGFGGEEEIARVKVGELYGYVDRAGEYVAEPIFEDGSFFNQGMAAVKLGGLWGYIGIDGQYVLEPQFESAGSFFYSKYAAVKKDGLWGAIRDDGSYVVPPCYERLGSFYDGYAEAMKDGLWGLIDEEGNWAVDPVYVVIGDRNDVCAVVSMDEEADLWSVYDVAPGAGLISLPEGNILLELGYDNISIAYDDGTVSAEKDGKTSVYRIVNGQIEEIAIVDSSLDLDVYKPNEGESVAVLDSEADFSWNLDHPLPMLDGATALLPIYSAFAQAIYPDTLRHSEVGGSYDEEEAAITPEQTGDVLFTCTKTAKAYERLMNGETDIIFCGGPSEKQTFLAKLNGVEFELTPIGHEAFVFIVNKDNPIDSITVEQIRDIYSGKTTAWADLGYPELGNIIAYQRSENSGSQTALEELMGNIPLMDAPEYVAETMSGIVDNIEYRNLENSIGYSFRFFVSGMMGSKVKLLAIDGIEPTEENIRNGSYPLISTFYAVSRKGETNPNVQAVLCWITGEQGQELVEKSGYVGIID